MGFRYQTIQTDMCCKLEVEILTIVLYTIGELDTDPIGNRTHHRNNLLQHGQAKCIGTAAQFFANTPQNPIGYKVCIVSCISLRGSSESVYRR